MTLSLGRLEEDFQTEWHYNEHQVAHTVFVGPWARRKYQM